jgi:hypothetical protein
LRNPADIIAVCNGGSDLSGSFCRHFDMLVPPKAAFQPSTSAFVFLLES